MEKKKNASGVGHKALYRKYRSKSLKEIVGQEHITKTLENAIKNGAISHAYLFTGPRGTGKTSVARILAHNINKLSYTEETNHLDIIEIDAASNRRIDDVRDLRDKVHIAPISAKYKVYIIDEVHMLTPESFNALLKTLEEPPAHVVFILATTEVHKLPATIISRTQRHSFRLIPVEKVKKHLSNIAKKEDLKITEEALELLAEHGGGSFRDSISLLDQISTVGEEINAELIEDILGLAPKNSIMKIINSITNHNIGELVKILDNMLLTGLTPVSIAEQLLKSIRSYIKSSPNSKLVDLMNELFEVQSAKYPQLKLESILIKYSLPNKDEETQKTIAKSTSAAIFQPIISSKVSDLKFNNIQDDSNKVDVKELNTKTTVKSSINSKLKINQEEILKIWPTILNDIKTANNSLYTVLKLSEPSIKNNVLSISFEYIFYQKKASEPKNKALIASIFNKYLKDNIELEFIITKNNNQISESKNTSSQSANASHIKKVQDIMGGGEIVNV